MNRSNLVEKDLRKNYTKIYHRLTLRKNIFLINIFIGNEIYNKNEIYPKEFCRPQTFWKTLRVHQGNLVV